MKTLLPLLACLWLATPVATAGSGLRMEDIRLACSASTPEPFGTFFRKFAGSPPFAAERTVLPLPVVRRQPAGAGDRDDDESVPTQTYVSREEFMQWPRLADFMANNGLTARLRSHTQSAVAVDVVKEDTDWLVTYHFRLANGCWRLWKYEDQSL